MAKRHDLALPAIGLFSQSRSRPHHPLRNKIEISGQARFTATECTVPGERRAIRAAVL
jgi:hypothetical protein